MKVKLEDIAVLINGDRGKNYPSQADIVPDGDVPFVNAGHLNGRVISFDEMNYISQEKYNRLNSGKFVTGDILYCLRGSLGKKAVVKNNIYGTIASSLVIIRPDAKKVDVDYLMFALDSPSIREQLVKANNGSSQPNLSAASVKSYNIDLPDRKIQEEVVAKLTKVRRIIDARQQEIQKLDDLIKARFVEIFGDPVLNPFGWEQTILKDIAVGKLSYGSGASATVYDGECRYVRITDITDSGELNDDIKSPDKYEEKYLLHDGDILFARSGATVGKTFRYSEKKHKKSIYAGYLIRLIPDKEKVLADYVFYYTKTEYYSTFVKKAQKAVAQPNINAQEYGNLIICLPPIHLQEEFVTFVQQVDKYKFASFHKSPSFLPNPSIFQRTCIF